MGLKLGGGFAKPAGALRERDYQCRAGRFGILFFNFPQNSPRPRRRSDSSPVAQRDGWTDLGRFTFSLAPPVNDGHGTLGSDWKIHRPAGGRGVWNHIVNWFRNEIDSDELVEWAGIDVVLQKFLIVPALFEPSIYVEIYNKIECFIKLLTRMPI